MTHGCLSTVPHQRAVFGELGLTGEVRPVVQAEKRILDAIKFGFKKIIIPKPNYDSLKKYSSKIEIIPVSYVSQAIKLLFTNEQTKDFESITE